MREMDVQELPAVPVRHRALLRSLIGHIDLKNVDAMEPRQGLPAVPFTICSLSLIVKFVEPFIH